MATRLLCRVHGTIYNVPENWNAHKGKSKDAQRIAVQLSRLREGGGKLD